MVLPNVRKLFIPDPGYGIFEADLSGADAQVVAWEAEDEDLKAAFRAGLDVHSKNAEDMWGTAFTSLPLDSSLRYKKRQNNKVAVHLTNYGGTARTLAITQGWTVHEAETFQKRWFSIHPGIRNNFHGKVRSCLNSNKTISNALGFRRVFFDRADACFGEALAWIPQSTVALVTFYGGLKLERACPLVEILLQVHDSLVFQCPLARIYKSREILDGLSFSVPYPDPLTIPWTLTYSEKSWGDCEKVKLD